MAITHGYVQLPPDGTGKHVPQSVMVEILYDTKTISFATGDLVTFSVTTSVTGTVISVDEETGTTGEIHIRIEEPVPNTFNFQVGENIIVGGATNAKIANADAPLYFQQVVLVGKEMKNQINIDDDGSMVTTFPEGSPQFDAYGKLQGSEQHKLADYVMSYDELPEHFETVITGGATLVYDNNVRGIVMTCGLASGDKVIRTSHEYHVYQPGVSQLIEFTGSMGDTGKANVIRRGGYYDDDNGVYFEFKETVFGVGLRSKASGSVVDTFITQSNWNKDTLDGSGGLFNPSGLAANPTVDNIYWIDLQWLGAGVIRFGVNINGVRIVAHEIRNASSVSYMSTGSLPFRYEQENIGVAASSSEFRMFCASVKTEGKFNPLVRAYTDRNSASITTVNETSLISLRASQTFQTFNNRTSMYPASFDVYNSAAEPILFTLRRGAVATAGSWVSHGGDSTVDINKTMTAVVGGKVRFSKIIGPGETKSIPFEALARNRSGLRRKADITKWTEASLGAQLLTAGTGGTVHVVINWDEVRD